MLMGVEVQKIGKALDFADKKEIAEVVIFGKDELKEKVYKLKDMKTGDQQEFPL